MKLQPAIASYSGATAAMIREFLTGSVLDLIGQVAVAPLRADQVDPAVLAELVEMHVLKEEDGTVSLQTAVFLEPDIKKIVPVAASHAREVAGLVALHGNGFRGARPEVTCFLGGVIGVQQGLGRALEQRGFAGEWKHYGGRYARAKVDFDEVCTARAALGPDYQTKSILAGERFTAVFIGPGPKRFPALAVPGDLVDAYSRLLLGLEADSHLLEAAEAAGLMRDGRPATSVITRQTASEYAPAVRRLTDVVSTYYASRLPELEELLATTASGRQGVTARSQSMHLWRYIRRATARELYAAGFLTDAIPRDGSLTVFVENGIPMLDGLI